jgi:hypothetical protein
VKDDKYMEKMLKQDQIKFFNQIFRHGSNFEQVVLEWCLDNLYPLTVIHEREWVTITYGELVMKPHLISKMLSERLGFPDPDRMARRARRPSGTTPTSSKEEFDRYGVEKLATRRFKNASYSDRQSADTILDRLGIDIYSGDSLQPAEWATHFGTINFEDPECSG